MRITIEQSHGVGWVGLVWSGLVWYGLVWVFVCIVVHEEKENA